MPRNAKKPRPRLSIDELNAVLKEYRAAHPDGSVTPAGGGPEDFERFFRAQHEGWAAVLVPLNLKVR